jgi:hypothetical protein
VQSGIVLQAHLLQQNRHEREVLTRALTSAD